MTHSLSTLTLRDQSPAEKYAALGPFAKRHGRFAKGTVLPETITPHCPRRKVSEFPEGFLKKNHIEALEHNQKIGSCCRHPENHEVEALKSHPDEPCADIYVFHCTCGRKHRFFCVGRTDTRPEWK